MLAVKERGLFSRLLEKVLPMQLHVQENPNRAMTPAEAVERLKERGLPIPPTLLALTSTKIADALNDTREDGVTDELDNRRFNEETGDSE
jgi:hypothetical protein